MNPRRLSSGTAVLLAALAALATNTATARGSDDASATEEFHQTYALSANGRVELQNINGAVHISTWDQNQVKVNAIKRAYDDLQNKFQDISAELYKQASAQACPRPGPQPGPQGEPGGGAQEGAGKREGDVVDAEFEVVDEDKKK